MSKPIKITRRDLMLLAINEAKYASAFKIRSALDIDSKTATRELHAFYERGFLQITHEDDNGFKRKLYSLTPLAVQRLEHRGLL